jgi:hypothetical protein
LNKETFFEAWKSYRAANPVEKKPEKGEGDDSETERIVKLLEESDDKQAPAAGGAGGCQCRK